MDSIEKELYRQLIDQKLIGTEELLKISSEAARLNGSLFLSLATGGKVPEEKLYNIMSGIMRVPFVNLKTTVIDPKAVKIVSVKFAWYYLFMPVKLDGNKLTIAISSPPGLRVLDEIRLNLHHEIALVLARRDDIAEMLKKHYGLGAETVDRMVAQGEVRETQEDTSQAIHGIDAAERSRENASVITLVNQIVLEAFTRRATDIHIEPLRGRLRLRYRIDGILHDQAVPDNLRHFLLPILSRLKIMAGLDISEHRIPQDGKAVVKTLDQILDLRLSFIPTLYGESVVVRILPRTSTFDLESLGLAERDKALIESLIVRPSGIIFVTGPTGSGKTTTLYSCLKKIDKIEKKVVAIEDPIEYDIDDTTQIQVNSDTGLSFAAGLRSILRHDPDIIMVGEVRDKETADIAIRVALTGHLVLSTLHTNDAATGATRLIDIGIEPYLVASSVEAFIAQRLVRVICQHCREVNTEVDENIRRTIIENAELSPGSQFVIYKGKGCNHCNGTGFFGRVALYEFLLVDKDIKRLIAQKATAYDIKLQAVQNGMRTLLQDGWTKVANGVTTPEEVLDVCHDVRLDVKNNDVASVPRFSQKVAVKDNKVVSINENKRIHDRIKKRVPIWVKLIEKGKGSVIRMNPGEGSRPDSAYGDKLFEKIDDRETIKETITDTIDISAGGVAFESQYLMPVGSIVEVKYSLPLFDEPVHCIARIVRVEKNIPKNFVISACYLDMSGAVRAKIQGFVKEAVSQQRRADISV